MAAKTQTKSSNEILKAIWDEVRKLRQDLILFSASEDLNDFAHPARVKNSYLKALKKYPPRLRWK